MVNKDHLIFVTLRFIAFDIVLEKEVGVEHCKQKNCKCVVAPDSVLIMIHAYATNQCASRPHTRRTEHNLVRMSIPPYTHDKDYAGSWCNTCTFAAISSTSMISSLPDQRHQYDYIKSKITLMLMRCDFYMSRQLAERD